MSFDWEDFLKVADILHEGASGAKLEEAMYRIAISRAYYAVFGIACGLKRKNGVEIPLKDPHKFIVDEFRDSENPQERFIGDKLNLLRRHRRQADYDNSVINIDTRSAESLRDARKALDALAKLK
jgi:uncharacterized protein (UPF0332 family)